jgi:hypothetical protein
MSRSREIDSDDLPPLQYAVLELLAARYRLGHQTWTVHTKLGATLRILERKGLISYEHGVTPHTYRVSLTELGREASMAKGYVSSQETHLAWLMWCYREGYLTVEDRAGMENWFGERQADPEDERDRLALLAMAREILADPDPRTLP